MNEYWRCPCGADCYAFGNPDELCWGDVEAVDEYLQYDENGEIEESMGFIHACAGHFDTYLSKEKFKPQPIK